VDRNDVINKEHTLVMSLWLTSFIIAYLKYRRTPGRTSLARNHWFLDIESKRDGIVLLLLDADCTDKTITISKLWMLHMALKNQLNDDYRCLSWHTIIEQRLN
jgi:hypothetical protein